MKKLLFTLLCLMGVIGVSAAESTLATSLPFGAAAWAGNSAYTETQTSIDGNWTLVNFNNNKNGWTNPPMIKCGRKNYDSTGEIITAKPIAEAIDKVELSLNAITAGNVTSITLYVADNDQFTGAETVVLSEYKTDAPNVFAIANPAANCYYKVEFVCTSASSNGVVAVSGLSFYYTPAAGPDEPENPDEPEQPTDPAGRKDAYMYFTPGIVEAEIGQPFTEPVLTKATDAPVLYTSSNTGVATVEALTGKVSLVAAGSALITATAPANANYLAGEAFYILNVTGKQGGGDEPVNPPTGAGIVLFDIANAGEWTPEGTGFTRTSTIEGTEFTITTDKAASTTDLIAPNANTFSWRVYKDSKFTIKSAKPMTKLVFSYDGADRAAALTLSEGWTGTLDETNLTYTLTSSGLTELTAQASEKQVRISKIVVTLGEGEGPNPPADEKVMVFDIANAGEWTGDANGYTRTSTVDGTEFTITTDKADSSTDLIAPNANTYSWRAYKGSKFTIKSAKPMTKLVFSYDGKNYAAALTLSEGWTGTFDETALTYTVTSAGLTEFTAQCTEKQVRIKTIEATLGEGGDTPNPPVDDSELAKWLEAKPAVDTPINTPLTAIYQNGKDLWVNQGDAWALVYGELSQTYNNGDVIPAPVSGKYEEYQSMPEFIPVASTFGAPTAGTAVAAEAVEIADLSVADAARYIRLEGVSIAADAASTDGLNFIASDGVNTVVLRNRYKSTVTIPVTDEATVYGFVGVFGENVQIYPILIEDESGNTPVPTELTATFNWADPASLMPAQNNPGSGADNAVSVDGVTFTSADITVVSAMGTNKTTPRLYLESNGSIDLRLYAGNTTTFTSAKGVITKIEITAPYKMPGAVEKLSAGSMSEDGMTWTGEAQTVTFGWKKYTSGETEFSPKVSAFTVYYADQSGIDGIEAEAEAPAVYYTLQGVRVENPAAGNIYIRVCGSKVDKILVK